MVEYFIVKKSCIWKLEFSANFTSTLQKMQRVQLREEMELLQNYITGLNVNVLLQILQRWIQFCIASFLNGCTNSIATNSGRMWQK